MRATKDNPAVSMRTALIIIGVVLFVLPALVLACVALSIPRQVAVGAGTAILLFVIGRLVRNDQLATRMK